MGSVAGGCASSMFLGGVGVVLLVAAVAVGALLIVKKLKNK